jgi:TolA-binding protein
MVTCARLQRPALLLAIIPVLLLLPLWAHAQATADDDQAFDLANGLFEREHWQDALGKYDQYIRTHPQHANLSLALFRAGECLYSMQQYERALTYYDRVTLEFPKSEELDDAWYRSGDCNFRLERFPQAVLAYQALLDKTPKSPLAPRAAYWLGEAQYRLAKYKDAIAAYENCLKLAPDGNYAAYATYSIALSKLKLGETRDGITRLEKMLEKFPKHDLTAEVLYRLGEAHYSLKEYDAALKSYQQVLTGYPKSRFAMAAASGIAWSYWSLEQYDKALAAFVELTKLPDKAVAQEAALRAADCLFLLKRYPEAAGAYGALARDKNGTAAFWQGMSLEKVPDKAGARKVFEEFVGQYPGHERAAEAFLHLGALQAEAGALEQAEQSYKAAQAKTTDPEIKAQARYGAAWAAFQRTKSTEDLKNIEAIVEDDPTSALGAQVAYQTGKLRFVRKDYSRAIQLLTLLVQNHPTDPNMAEALYLMGASYEKAGNEAKAEEFYGRVTAKYATSEFAVEASGRLVAIYAKSQRVDQARSLAADMQKKWPDSPTLAVAQYAVAEALFAARDYAGAADQYKLVLGGKAAQLLPYAQYSLGACSFAQGDYKAAQQAFQAVLDKYADSEAAPAAKYQMAVTLVKSGQREAAVKVFEELLASNPKGEIADDALLELGCAYVELKDNKKALATFEKLLTDQPQSAHLPEAWFRIGEIRYEQSEFPLAQAAYEKVLALAPKSDLAPGAAYKLGWALLKQEKFEDAIAPLTLAGETATDVQVSTDARYQAATCHLKQSRFDQAVKLLEPTRGKAPQNLAARCLVLLGQAYLGLKNYQAAGPVFQEAVTGFGADPLYPRALLGLGRCQKADKKYDEAALTFTKVTGTKDTQAAMEAQFELAETRRLQNDYRTAAMEYLKVAILYGDPEWGARAQYAAGLCYEQANDTDNAIKAYRVVVERYSTQTEWAKKAAERIKALE